MDKIGEIERLQRLRELGALTEEEFQHQKKLILEMPLAMTETTSSVGNEENQENRTDSTIEVYSDEGETEFVGSSNRIRNIVLLCIFLAAIVGAVIFYRYSFAPTSVVAEVTGPANARDAPSADNSNVISQLDRGASLVGTWVEGTSDPSSKWLKSEVNGKTIYVWSGNLKEIAPSDNAEELSTEDVETSQNLPDNAPSFEISRDIEKEIRMQSMGVLFGSREPQFYILNTGKAETLRSVRLNGRDDSRCTLWPIYGYKDYEWYPARENPYVRKENAEFRFLFLGQPNQKRMEAGIETRPGEHTLTLAVGDKIDFNVPSVCGNLVTLDVSTDYGTYTLRYR